MVPLYMLGKRFRQRGKACKCFGGGGRDTALEQSARLLSQPSVTIFSQ